MPRLFQTLVVAMGFAVQSIAAQQRTTGNPVCCSHADMEPQMLSG
jgi:hypothetical protein